MIINNVICTISVAMITVDNTIITVTMVTVIRNLIKLTH